MIKLTGALKRAYDLLKQMVKPETKQTTFCYCPECQNELVSNGRLVSDEDCVTYQCVACHTISEWHFDTPAPILLRVNGVEVDSDTAAHEGCGCSH